MAKKTPPLVIPVTVDASGVSKGLNDVNNRLKRGTGGTVTGSGIGGVGQAGGFVAQGGGGIGGSAAADYFASRLGTSAALGRVRNYTPAGTIASTPSGGLGNIFQRFVNSARTASGGRLWNKNPAYARVNQRLENLADLGLSHMEDPTDHAMSVMRGGAGDRRHSFAFRRRERLTAERQEKLLDQEYTRKERVAQQHRFFAPSGGRLPASNLIASHDVLGIMRHKWKRGTIGAGRMYQNLATRGSSLVSAMGGGFGLGIGAAAAGLAYANATSGSMNDISSFAGTPDYRNARLQEIREFKARRRGERSGFWDNFRAQQLRMTGGAETSAEKRGGAISRLWGGMGRGLGWQDQNIADAWNSMMPYANAGNTENVIKTIENNMTAMRKNSN